MLTTVKPIQQLSSVIHAAEDFERTAIFDQTGQYRYRLGRRWQSKGATVTFIMLNPSTADAAQDDPTLRACIQFAQRWNYSALSVVNLFGYRTPYPRVLKLAAEPVGVENDAHVMRAVDEAETVVLGWGNFGGLLGRDRAILSLLAPYKHKLHYLQRNKSGHPRHPLYIKRTSTMQPYY